MNGEPLNYDHESLAAAHREGAAEWQRRMARTVERAAKDEGLTVRQAVRVLGYYVIAHGNTSQAAHRLAVRLLREDHAKGDA